MHHYRDDFFPLSRVRIVAGKDVENPGPLVQVLIERIRTYGGAAEATDAAGGDFTTLVSLGQTDVAAQVNAPSVPEREQAYVIACGQVDGRNVVVLKGRDRQGLLWAICSFNQLVHQEGGQPRVRPAEVSDYPIALRRGYLHGNVDTFNERFTARMSQLYNLAFKFNAPVYKHLSRNYYHMKHTPGYWRDTQKPRVEDANVKEIGTLLTPLGIEWYGGFHPVVGPTDQKLNGSPADMEILLHCARQVAAAGGHFYIQLDDFRFPLHPYDKEKFGTARKAGSHILSELDRRLRAEFPRARIMVVPPFYWGPLGSVPDWYGEPRDPYLEEIGKLPASVEIQWTGPRVKSTLVKKESVDWIAARIRRKPVYWQNGWGTSHPNYEHYVAEPVRCWPEWYYDGFLDGIECHTFNATFPQMAVLVATIADYCWNPKAYDPAKSVEEAVGKLVGPQAYGALEVLSKELTYFDQFGYNVSTGAARFADEMAEHAKAVERLWTEAISRCRTITAYSSLGDAVAGVRGYVEKLKANPALGANAGKAEEVRKDAIAETKLVEKRDAFFSPYDFTGGLGPREYSNRCPKRLALWLYGAQSGLNTAKLRFPVDPFPPSGDYLLVLSGQDDDLEKPRGIRIAVNGKVIFEGGSPFARNDWSRHTFKLPAASLKPGNELVIEVTDPGDRGQPPWLMVNYAVLRRTWN